MMHNAEVQIITPILVDGVWRRSGKIELPIDAARAEEAKGTVEIISVDGEAAAWPACCSQT